MLRTLTLVALPERAQAQPAPPETVAGRVNNGWPPNASSSRRPSLTNFFTGDYEGLAATGDFLAFFSQPHGSDSSSTFFRRIGP